MEEEKTLLKLEHRNFENHGKGAETYCEAMDSEMGWTYILEKFKKATQVLVT